MAEASAVRACANADEMRAAFAPIWHYFGQTAPSDDAVKHFRRIMTPERVYAAFEGEKAVEGRFAADSIRTPTGTFDGTYGDSEVHVDCSSQVKTLSWIEVRCRVLVDGETATTLIM